MLFPPGALVRLLSSIYSQVKTRSLFTALGVERQPCHIRHERYDSTADHQVAHDGLRRRPRARTCRRPTPLIDALMRNRSALADCQSRTGFGGLMRAARTLRERDA